MQSPNPHPPRLTPATTPPATTPAALTPTAIISAILALAILAPPATAADSAPPDALTVAAEVDRLILAEIQQAAAQPAPRASDEDFLRRVYLDLAGRLPAPQETTAFARDPDQHKRAKVIDRLLASDHYAENWARYWRDVIFTDAAQMQARLMAGTFEDWMTDQLRHNRPWDHITTQLLTATGNVQENGATALLVAHSAEPAEVAAEVSRIFLGIQIQCANCHDHRTDAWKREQFHELAAYFPRAEFRVRRVDGELVREIVSVNTAPRGGSRDRLFENAEGIIRRLDRNRDDRLSPREARAFPPLANVFERLLQFGDTDKDGQLTAAEMKKIPPPPAQAGRRTLEYTMPNLDDPSSPGTPMQPAFFLDGSSPGTALDDLARRQALAESITSPDNPWFARAFVNRVAAELLGEGFYTPVDDLGPERSPQSPQALNTLSEAFTAGGYDIQWLLRTITNTQTYQREIREAPATKAPATGVSPVTVPVPAFASARPTRLRSDQIYTALTQVLDVEELAPQRQRRRRGPYTSQTPRNLFHLLFAADPSAPHDEITGNVPQALFLMNSPVLSRLLSAEGNTRLARLLREFPDDRDAITQLYLVALCRRPSDNETKVCLDYLQQVDQRTDAYEDLLWALLNSTEFVSRR